MRQHQYFNATRKISHWHSNVLDVKAAVGNEAQLKRGIVLPCTNLELWRTLQLLISWSQTQSCRPTHSATFFVVDNCKDIRDIISHLKYSSIPKPVFAWHEVGERNCETEMEWSRRTQLLLLLGYQDLTIEMNMQPSESCCTVIRHTSTIWCFNFLQVLCNKHTLNN